MNGKVDWKITDLNLPDKTPSAGRTSSEFIATIASLLLAFILAMASPHLPQGLSGVLVVLILPLGAVVYTLCRTYLKRSHLQAIETSLQMLLDKFPEAFDLIQGELLATIDELQTEDE
jgi:fructose-specific phosphotransferase system IIC component